MPPGFPGEIRNAIHGFDLMSGNVPA